MGMNLRAADADRDRAVAKLGEHTAAGRLTLDEFDTRARAAYAARAMADLAALTVDLPDTEPPPTAQRHPQATALYAVAAIVFAVVLLGVLAAAVSPAIVNGMAGMAGMMDGRAGGCQ